MKFQTVLFVFATFFTVSKADTFLRSQHLENAETLVQKPKENVDKKTVVDFDEPSEKVEKNVAERDTLLKALPLKHRENKKQTIWIFKGGNASETKLSPKQREDRRSAVLLWRNGKIPQNEGHESHPVKHREDRKKMIVFFKGGEASGPAQTGDKRAVQNDALLNALRNRYNQKNVAKRDTLFRSLPTSDKRAIAPKASVRVVLKSGEVDEDKAGLAAEKKDDELKRNVFSLLKADTTKGSEKERAELENRRRDAIIAFLKNRKAASVAQRDSLLRDDVLPTNPRRKRDIAATVVGAAVSSVVSNLMKTVEESVVKAENEAKKLQADVLDSDQGRILSHGEVFVPISQDAAIAKKPIAPVSNEAVPLPFAPVKAYDAPKSNDFVPNPFAPIHADVEVVVGNNVTSTTTAKPVADKRGFFSTLFNSFKLFFGTVTNSVGGFSIDMGSRITNFVEKRIKV